MINTYLFLAFSFVWLIFIVYAWTLSRRHARLRKELEELKASIDKSDHAVGSERQATRK